jgi:glycosyltransferase involved in cell wall biosynthesis
MLRNFEPVFLPALPEAPLFSVLIRNHNYGQFLETALQSVLDQTYQNFEIIVCDDGSTDNSRDIADKFSRQDSRITLITQPNSGVATAANTAYQNSKGDLIALLDADDRFKPTKLKQVLSVFRNSPRSGLCVHPVLPVSATGQPLGAPYPGSLETGWLGPQKLRAGGCTSFPPSSGLVLRREIASELFPIPAEIRIMEDFFLAGTAQFLTEVSMTQEALTEFRVHKNIRSDSSEHEIRPAFSTFKPEVHMTCAKALETVLPAQREVLRRCYGSGIAEILRLEDNPGYWDVLLAICALRGRAGAIRPYSIEEMIRHVPRPAEKRIWRAVMLMPGPLARRTYRFWRSPSRLKNMIKTVVLPVIRR